MRIGRSPEARPRDQADRELRHPEGHHRAPAEEVRRTHGLDQQRNQSYVLLKLTPLVVQD